VPQKEHGPLRRRSLDDITIEDAATLRHVGVYRALVERVERDGMTFAVPGPDSPLAGVDPTRLLNLAFWHPGEVSEILPDPTLSADQLAHNAWHHVAQRALGEDAHSVAGLLLAEAVASAFDVYLVGRLLGQVPDAPFLESQVPAMSEAAAAADCDEARFAALLERMSAEPERSFEQLRSLLYDLSLELAASVDADAAAATLLRHADHPFAPLTHHYELPTWVLFARAYADPKASGEAARRADAALRQADDPIAWLETNWVAS
jgi:hypothetical protein